MNENNDDNFELDSELAKSIEKLVDEETTVAKAFVDRNSLDKEVNASKNSLDSEDISKTRTIPAIPSRQIIIEDEPKIAVDTASETISTRLSGDTYQDSTRSDASTTIPERNNVIADEGSIDNTTKASGEKKKLDKKTKLIIAGVTAAVLIVIVAIIAVSVYMSNRNKSSYDYNYNKGIEYYNAKKYDTALGYLEKAAVAADGKRNIDLKFKLYECYVAENNNGKAVETLIDILSYEKNNEKALTALAANYASNKMGDKLTELIRSRKGTDGEKYLTSYVVTAPTASDPSGSYQKALDLEITSADGNTLYYTIDGTEPTSKSTLYTEMIHLVKGTTTVKVIAVNKIGTSSDVVELKYVVDYKAPDAPELSPATGKTYEEGQKISITNLKPGETAYYTLDGSTPTTSSRKYEGEFAMPVGNTIVSAITVNEYNLSSTITRKNYIATAIKTYTYDEAITFLKARMKTVGDLKTETTTSDGKKADFVYYTKTKINDVDMYLTYYDIAGVRQKYYFGIGVKNGKCYKVTESGGTFTAAEY